MLDDVIINSNLSWKSYSLHTYHLLSTVLELGMQKTSLCTQVVHILRKRWQASRWLRHTGAGAACLREEGAQGSGSRAEGPLQSLLLHQPRV